MSKCQSPSANLAERVSVRLVSLGAYPLHRRVPLEEFGYSLRGCEDGV